MTTARQIADKVGGGWNDADGRHLTAVLAAHDARSRTNGQGDVRYELPDGSCIIISGGGWDLALCPEDDGCYCWRGQDGRHVPGCPSGPADTDDEAPMFAPCARCGTRVDWTEDQVRDGNGPWVADGSGDVMCDGCWPSDARSGSANAALTAAHINALLPVERNGVSDNLWPTAREHDGKWIVNDYTGQADDEVYDSEGEAVDAAISWAMATHPDLDEDEDEALRIYRECDKDAAFDLPTDAV